LRRFLVLAVRPSHAAANIFAASNKRQLEAFPHSGPVSPTRRQRPICSQNVRRRVATGRAQPTDFGRVSAYLESRGYASQRRRRGRNRGRAALDLLAEFRLVLVLLLSIAAVSGFGRPAEPSRSQYFGGQQQKTA